jgi:hypothetical protein
VHRIESKLPWPNDIASRRRIAASCYGRDSMSRRLEFLLNMTSKSADPFAWYGLAMEYRSLSRFEEAIATF